MKIHMTSAAKRCCKVEKIQNIQKQFESGQIHTNRVEDLLKKWIGGGWVGGVSSIQFVFGCL